jgi:N6-adenosine-specific RNA methylase IME4
MKHHPAADAFPMMDDKRYQELVNDIREHGQREDVCVYDGMILDGRNRHKACLELQIEPRTKVISTDANPWDFVWSLNGLRRDLVAEQRYLVWKFCHEHGEAWQADRARIQEEANLKRSKAAKAQHEVSKPRAGEHKPVMVEEHSVPPPKEKPERKAKAAASKTNPGAVARGDKIVKERPDLAEGIRLGTMKPAAAHRQMKKDEVKEKTKALPEGKHRVIYADPPWKYKDAQAVKGDYGTGTGAVAGHYPPMPLAELKALDIKGMAAEDSVLFLWATSPLLEDALELCKAWGFSYKASFVWDKVKHNMGHYNSVRHEFLLIATRGSGTPEVSKLFDSVQVIERQEHSRKPEEFRKIIDVLYPSGPRIELFCRGKQPDGWKTWGNEAE